MERDYAFRSAELAVETARRRIRESRELLGEKRYTVCALPPADAVQADGPETGKESPATG